MRVKVGTYIWLFLTVALLLLSAWKSYNGLETLRQAEATQPMSDTGSVLTQGETSVQDVAEVNKDQVYGWFAAVGLAVVFFLWRCYRFVEEKKAVEFLIKERRKNEEIERRIKLKKAEQERKWFEENRVR